MHKPSTSATPASVPLRFTIGYTTGQPGLGILALLIVALVIVLGGLLSPAWAAAAATKAAPSTGPINLFGIPVDFIQIGRAHV